MQKAHTFQGVEMLTIQSLVRTTLLLFMTLYFLSRMQGKMIVVLLAACTGKLIKQDSVSQNKCLKINQKKAILKSN